MALCGEAAFYQKHFVLILAENQRQYLQGAIDLSLERGRRQTPPNFQLHRRHTFLAWIVSVCANPTQRTKKAFVQRRDHSESANSTKSPFGCNTQEHEPSFPVTRVSRVNHRPQTNSLGCCWRRWLYNRKGWRLPQQQTSADITEVLWEMDRNVFKAFP